MRRFGSTRGMAVALGAGRLESWVSELHGEHRAHSTIRSYQLAVGAFCDYTCDPAYGWAASCLAQFASAPSQVCRAENLATHASEYEGRRARRSLTRDELQALFDAADDDVVSNPGTGQEGLGPRLPSRRHPQGRLWVGAAPARGPHARRSDFAPNPKAAEFGDYGVCQVRFGKAAKGGPPRRARRAHRLRLVGRSPRRMGR